MRTEGRIPSRYEPEQDGLLFPRYPEFTSAADERTYRKQHLAAACRAFGRMGFSYGFAGHLTVRDPEDAALYWTNPFAVPFMHVRSSNLILVDHKGVVVEGAYAVNRAGFVLHAAIHEANPDAVASCHAHTPYGMAWATLGRELDPITQDACSFFDDQAVIRTEAGAVVLESDAARQIALAFAGKKVAIHQNHGLFSVGRESIDEAAWWLIALEHACRVQLLAESAGRPTLVETESAVYTRSHIATPFMGWLHFQPIFNEVVAAEPDVLS